MNDYPLLKPKTITVTDGDGDAHELIISRFPAVEGLEFQLMYPSSLALAAVPKVGEYKVSQDLMYRILRYVAKDIKGTIIRMETPQLIQSHIGDWEALVKVLWEVMQYNNSFFQNGTALDFLESIFLRTLTRISETLAQSSGP